MKNTRNYGIDLLRLVSMYMVVVLHILGHGGALAESGVNFYITWFFETAALCAVDCFAIISGYVGYSPYEKKGQIGKILAFWVQVFFWSFGITLIFFMRGEVGIKDLIKSTLPISSNSYWYASSYIPILFLSPWLNKFIARLDDKEIKRLLVIIVVVISCYYIVAFADPFSLKFGYSAIWLIIMYMSGAGMKRLEIPEKIRAKYAVIIMVACLLTSWGWKCFSPIQAISLLTYTSPTIIAIAVILIFMFSKFKLTGKWIKRFAPSAFGVYLIHENSIIRSKLMNGSFVWIPRGHPAIIPFAILGSALAIFVVCICIEKIRLLVFESFSINKLITNIGNRCENKLKILDTKWIITNH